MAQDPVLELIDKNGLAYTVSGQDYLIHCLNPEHDDSNPSLRVDKLSGAFHCFSCGYKGNLFRHFGILTSLIPTKIALLKEKLDLVKATSLGIDLPKGYTPYSKVFRGISARTLKHFGAFYTNQEEKLQDRIIFPIPDITNKTVAYIGRHLHSNGNPRYYIYPRHVKMPVMPCKLDQPGNTLVLVEGIFDMLNLYDKGMRNVVCCFGTNTLSFELKDKLLPFLAQGVQKVFILFDGDTPGKKAAQQLKPQLEQLELQVEIIDLPDDVDPGDLDQENVTALINYTS